LKIDAIQILRAIAANFVVLNHVWAIEQKFDPIDGILPFWFEGLGPLGVKVFFVISGFVILRVSYREGWGEFLFARVTRIYPIEPLAKLRERVIFSRISGDF
jgi:peptidoglycan/LPS O-acetylase OafA/YrhL